MSILDKIDITINRTLDKRSGVLNNFCKEVKKNNPYIPPEVVKPELAYSPVFNVSVLKDKLMNVDELNDKELYELIYNNCDKIMSNIFDYNDLNTLEIFMQPRFLTILNQVLYKLNITYDIKIYCNKIVYDCNSLEYADRYTKDLLLGLAKTVNRNEIAALVGLGLDEEYATNLTIARFSSKKELANIKRLNFAICNANKEFMTEQMIIHIYEKLIDNFTTLFKGTMFDYYNTSMMSEDHQEIYSLISLAVLDILNNMPSEKIKIVLSSYAGDYYSFVNTNHTPRFSLHYLSYDYIRITQVIQYLANVEQIIVP